jgi:hypothetical protein
MVARRRSQALAAGGSDGGQRPAGVQAAAGARGLMNPDSLLAWISPTEFSPFGAKRAAVRCPSDLDPLSNRSAPYRRPGAGGGLYHGVASIR